MLNDALEGVYETGVVVPAVHAAQPTRLVRHPRPEDVSACKGAVVFLTLIKEVAP